MAKNDETTLQNNIDLLKSKTIGFISLGCDKNRVDLEKMIYKCKDFGFKVVNDPKKASIIIVNTCSFIESARVESIETILEMANYKSNATEKLIVTGCINEMNFTDLEESLPEVDAFVSIKDNDNIVSIIAGLYGIRCSYICEDYKRVLTTARHYAYLKIADGCNNFCTYCTIPNIRGRFKSVPIEDLVIEAKSLVDNGATELILVAQDVTKYGVDIYKEKSLVRLIQELSKIDSLKWIRLLYLYPEQLDDNLIYEIRDNPKVCKYVDMPLQHISDNILKKMNRKSSKQYILDLITKLRLEIPNIVIRSTFILGFPGETSENFEELCEFIKEYKLDNVGFFTYSREEGTPAYNFENQVPEDVKKLRLKAISSMQYDVIRQLHADMLDTVVEVVVDSKNSKCAICRYYGQCPQVDSVILVDNPDEYEIGQYYKITLKNLKNYDFKGEK